MNKEQIEKRQSVRVFFSEDDGIQAILTSQVNKSLKVPLVIMSISAGGLSFIADRYKLHQVQVGDRLAVTSMSTPPPLGVIKKVEVQLKYKLDYQLEMGVFFGCQFINISDNLRNKIDKFVHLKLKNLDNESLSLQ